MRRFLVCLSATLLVGCAGYKLGPTNGLPAGSRSIQVNPFQNETFEPRLSEPVTSALRKRLQQDGTYLLDTQGGGSIVVNGVITRFERGHISFDPRDVITVRDYRLTLTAHITAVERATGKTNFNRMISGSTVIRVGNDQTSAERQAVPLLAADLAERAKSLIVDGQW